MAILDRRFTDRWGERARLDLSVERTLEDAIVETHTPDELAERLATLGAEIVRRMPVEQVEQILAERRS
jgi:hypothetical protein